MRRDAAIKRALGFDDVLIAPRETNVKPADVSLKTRLTKDIEMNLPFISAGMPHVTESKMAIAMAQLGGIGVIHGGMPLGKQVEEVRRVKRAEGNMVGNPITISAEASLAEALDLMTTYKVSGLPVVEASQNVVGIITNRDIRFFEDYAKPVSELMSKDVITVRDGVDHETVKRLLHEHRIEKLVVVDDQHRCTGLYTVKDIEKLSLNPNATRDKNGRLRAAAAVGLGKDALDRASAMADAGLDVVFVDVAQGQSREAVGTVSTIRQQRTTEVQIVAGNVATPDAARSFIDAGADAIKVGIGGMASSGARQQLGVGMPQVTALVEVFEQCDIAGVPVIVDGLYGCAATIAKAFAAGGASVVFGCNLAGAKEAPGKLSYCEGKAYKTMGPASAPAATDPYKLGGHRGGGGAPLLGPVEPFLQHVASDLKMALAYAGAASIKDLAENAELVEI
ncbi:MAG: IMP dehydrogenase [Alphaproteobacteria bacterium]|nr:IMP dehydrogenase [Alphaproteobacteria bacterium]